MNEKVTSIGATPTPAQSKSSLKVGQAMSKINSLALAGQLRSAVIVYRHDQPGYGSVDCVEVLGEAEDDKILALGLASLALKKAGD